MGGVVFKVYASLAAAALRSKSDREYRLWTVCRGLDVDGSGRISEAELNEFVTRLRGLRGLSPDYTRRLLRSGDGVFWTLYRKSGFLWIRLHGLGSVSVALGVRRLRKWPVLVTVEQIARLQTWRGIILASQFTGKRLVTNPISRATLERITGYTERTQRRWQGAVDGTIRTFKNGAVLDWNVDGEIDTDALDERNSYIAKWNGRLIEVQRLPNSYHARLKVGRKGMLARVNKVLHSKSVQSDGTDDKYKKLFYGEPEQKRVLARLRKADEGDTFYEEPAFCGKRRARRSACGAYLWGVHSIANGGMHYGR